MGIDGLALRPSAQRRPVRTARSMMMLKEEEKSSAAKDIEEFPAAELGVVTL